MIFEFSAPIFKILLDSKANYLAIEVRNSTSKEVTFSVIDLKKRTICLEETGFEEAWRVGLSAVENHILLLHSYTDNRLPDKKGIFAVDFLAQEVLWEYPLGKFESLHQKNNQMIISASQVLQGKQTIFLDLLTGNEIEVANKEIAPLPTQFSGETHFYNTENEYFSLFCNFAIPHLPTNAQLVGFDYVELENSFWLLCYYKTNMQTTTMSLLNFDAEGNLLASHKLSTQLSEEQIGNRLFTCGNLIYVLLSGNSLQLIDINNNTQ